MLTEGKKCPFCRLSSIYFSSSQEKCNHIRIIYMVFYYHFHHKMRKDLILDQPHSERLHDICTRAMKFKTKTFILLTVLQWNLSVLWFIFVSETIEMLQIQYNPIHLFKRSFMQSVNMSCCIKLWNVPNIMNYFENYIFFPFYSAVELCLLK